ncbi:MAG: septum formation initiator family protein [Rhodobacteraceae bacterium]|nr:septum formation initiator family protein [Paracoccaceae bacterium]
MSVSRKRPTLGMVLYTAGVGCLGFYFTFAAVQGDFGVFRRVQASAEKEVLTRERDGLRLEVARMENLTHRMSDDYLDLDLLDERARDVLGLIRSDEIVIH